ncbi:hypothetical protein F4820DRAFT_1986 [Hypoxylon rubiginosum]|uniref:Uncharacterized protein n=1 Tax=Hypoxylon rubiginosum TaxID=110542 RepID=A0ACB9ZHC3_9PEZI|nr:hypothetical protein F4820DRAFT_1986 [Hypoxylon rubiginosum]
MSLPAPAPSLLLTKRLTAFLSANLSAQVHTAALTTLSGKLLAHASPHPVGALRTRCTVAASIWAQYASPAAGLAVEESLPSSHRQTFEPVSPGAVTIQLAGGVVVIRRLRCGLLFVCVGPAAAGGGGGAGSGGGGGGDGSSVAAEQHSGAMPTPQYQQQQSQQQQPPSTPGDNRPPTPPLGSPSVESVASLGAATTASVATTTASTAGAGVVAMRRQAEELARWLDDKLGTLGVLEELLGIETR